MADIITGILIGLVDLIKSSVFFSIIGFIFFLVGYNVHKELRKHFKRLNWLFASFLTTFLLVLLFFSIIFFVPFITAPNTIETPELQPDLSDYASNFALQVARTVFVSFIIALLLMPFELFASLVNDYLIKRRGVPKKREFPWVNYFISCFVSVFILVTLVTFAFPWVVSGLLYFLFFA